MQETRSANTSSGIPVRHPSATPETVRKPKLLNRLRESLRSRHYRPHTFRHSFATHLLQDGYDIRTIQEVVVRWGLKEVQSKSAGRRKADGKSKATLYSGLHLAYYSSLPHSSVEKSSVVGF